MLFCVVVVVVVVLMNCVVIPFIFGLLLVLRLVILMVLVVVFLLTLLVLSLTITVARLCGILRAQHLECYSPTHGERHTPGAINIEHLMFQVAVITHALSSSPTPSEMRLRRLGVQVYSC